MTKAVRMMQENIKLIDLMIELIDARIPLSSRNPDIDGLAGDKARLIVLNKADLADRAANLEWTEYFNELGLSAIALDSRSTGGMKLVNGRIQEVCRDKIEKDRKRGILNRPIRAMVAGIPNVGKSTFINSLAGKAIAKTGNKPGVTKGKQWIRLNRNVELLDTPGILWPKFDDRKVGLHLAMIGSINDDILDGEEIARELIDLIRSIKTGVLCERYKLDSENGASFELLERIALSRGCLIKGGQPDIGKAADILIDDFRSGRLAAISLERAPLKG